MIMIVEVIQSDLYFVIFNYDSILFNTIILLQGASNSNSFFGRFLFVSISSR